MARKRIKTVRLERQPHKDAVQRLCLSAPAGGAKPARVSRTETEAKHSGGQTLSVRSALYARVSTPNQEEETTIDSQVAAIENYIQQRGYELPVECYFLDKVVSGARLERPTLDRLRHLAADSAFSVVVCYSPDRLSRTYPHQWVVVDELQRQGVRIEFVN